MSGTPPVPDFTGHWKQVKNENADGYLKTMGAPFVLRRVVVPVMGKSTDIVKQAGDLQVVTTINVKGAWTRKYIIGQEVAQKNAEGDDTVATCWWDNDEKEFPGKMIHKSKMVGGKRGVSESWRWFDGGLMVIKSIVFLKKEKVAWMLWYFESIEPVRNENFLSAKKKLKQITREQKLIAEITEKQTEEMKEAMKEMSTIQQAFIVEMLSKKNKGSASASPSKAASKWKAKAKAPARKETEEEDDEFFDCTEEQTEQIKKIEEQIEKIDINDAVSEPSRETKTFLCFPVSSKKIKRLPTVVMESLMSPSSDK